MTFQWPGFQHRLHLDYETRSACDLRKAGVHKYAKDPSTCVLMLGWAVDESAVQLWLPHREPMPPYLREALLHPQVAKTAFNATFERIITRDVLQIDVPLEQWRCTMVAAFYLGFAGDLDQILSEIGLPSKDARGSRLINLFSSPAPKNHKVDWYTYANRPQEFQEFCEYCHQDVTVERQLLHWLAQYPMMQRWDWDRYALDQKINDRGVPVDLAMAEGAIKLWENERKDLTSKLSLITGLSNPTRGPMLNWLQLNGVSVTDLQKTTLEAEFEENHSPQVKDAINLWGQREAKAVSKYTAVLSGAGADARVRGMFQFKGASRTDRTSGRRLQLQNLKRAYAEKHVVPHIAGAISQADAVLLKLLSGRNIANALGGAIRHVICASEGKTLAVCDLTSIESVVLGWIACCPLIDETFRAGRDSYKVFASKYYRIPYEEVTKAQRSFSKPPVLGCGYMLGWRGLIAYAEGYGVEMTQDEAQNAVNTFRGMYPEIPRFWYWLYDAIKNVIRTGLTTQGYRLRIERDEDFLRIWLPSGRALSYFKPAVQTRLAPWDEDGTQFVDNVSYMGMNDKNQWVRIFAHAGLFTENIVQSISMDILFNGLENAEAAELDPVIQVHDEIGCEVDEGTAESSLQKLQQGMTNPPSWARDMWLGAAGYIFPHYTKD